MGGPCVVVDETTALAAARSTPTDYLHGAEYKQKLMKASDIPAFVEEVIKIGCDICASVTTNTWLETPDLSPGDYEKAKRG